MRRRAFITLLGGAMVWPLAARAQQPERMRRIGVICTWLRTILEGQARKTAFVQALQQFGWSDGRNGRIEIRWGTDAGNTRRYVAELVALAPDVIVAAGSATMAALQQTTRTVPIVFMHVVDPVGGGFVESLPRLDGNATGFVPNRRARLGPARRWTAGAAGAGSAPKNTPVTTPLSLGSWAATCSFLQVPAITHLG